MQIRTFNGLKGLSLAFFLRGFRFKLIWVKLGNDEKKNIFFFLLFPNLSNNLKNLLGKTSILKSCVFNNINNINR
jgi:hypothetical protein